MKRTKFRKSLSGGTKRTKSRKSLSGGTKRTKSRKSLSGGVIGFVNPKTYNYNDLYEEVLELLDNNRDPNKLLTANLTAEQLQNNTIKSMSITSFRVGAPLHIAAGINNLDLAEELLSNGAVIDLPDRPDLPDGVETGHTPLYIACLKGHLDVANLLVENGAVIDRADDNGATPLYIACLKGHFEVAKLLVENGAVIDRADNEGTTPLAIAMMYKHTNIKDFKHLLQKKKKNPD